MESSNFINNNNIISQSGPINCWIKRKGYAKTRPIAYEIGENYL